MHSEPYILRPMKGGKAIAFGRAAGGELQIEGERSVHVRVLQRTDAGHCVLLVGSRVIQGSIRKSGGHLVIESAGQTAEFSLEPAAVDAMRQHLLEARPTDLQLEIRNPIPGLVKAVEVVKGAKVVAGQTLAVLEAMKMENEIRAPHAGIVERVEAQKGQSIPGGSLMFVIVPE